ncbi:precorrin-8X methylmutase [Aestuariirhabdus litorea]|uniref:Precorrin-8X methylmutase n=1 Tax=Aestuariirhabdus litorea TaxID=2528527 RepID=A0A3P3VSQ7_9GAMM|nr:precorrin-8X methylmutase [Aestuariirhabdus litorea]RRJ84519.1 precorrin-8X methylmutase [Aestuariirhabdus litorea]RWW97744.1 precorrin-8X methylmutase [Endozoicomonadaceae bacterium GTF-13]
MYDYQKDPVAIEHESFRQIRALTDLSAFSADEAQIAMRLVHTCGEPAVVDGLRLSAGAVEAGLQALGREVPILCDVEMVRHGLTRRYIHNPTHCFLNAEGIGERAKALGETRTMAALEHWPPLLEGAIVVIGNAPTALFRLLEMLAAGEAKPALVIGMPVGFVGAEESKAALWKAQQRLGVNCITLLGRRGGSALAVSALNALARIRIGERY